VPRIVQVFSAHEVDYLVVGGIATQAYGSTRPTTDFDCLVLRAADNLGRLGAAMRELNARLRVEGLSDEEAAELPVQVDALTLSRTEISAWRTDAGDIDLLVDISGKEGRLCRYEDLAGSARHLQVGGVYVRVASLQDIIASKEQANRAKDRDALPELYELRAKQGSTRPGPPTQLPPPEGPEDGAHLG
jgi:hypothetical protein